MKPAPQPVVSKVQEVTVSELHQGDIIMRFGRTGWQADTVVRTIERRACHKHDTHVNGNQCWWPGTRVTIKRRGTQ